MKPWIPSTLDIIAADAVGHLARTEPGRRRREVTLFVLGRADDRASHDRAAA